MIASELISTAMIPLMTSDTGESALLTMSDFLVKHLPIVNETQLLGVLSEEDILNNPIHDHIGSYQLMHAKAYVKHNDHLFDIMRTMSEKDLSVIPVIDDEGNYMGMITQGDLLDYYAKSFSFQETGGILILEMAKRDYVLSEIARIVEGEQAAILASFISNSSDPSMVLLTLKINKQDLEHLKASFQRFGYIIKGSYVEDEYYDNLKDRYDMLMNYLDV